VIHVDNIRIIRNLYFTDRHTVNSTLNINYNFTPIGERNKVYGIQNIQSQFLFRNK